MNRVMRLLILLVAVVGVGFIIYRSVMGLSGMVPPADGSAQKGYSAVFLSNDQVYFGKVSMAGKVVTMKDIYYIRLNQPQPQLQEGADQTQQPQLSLVKLGDQIHGPVDEMRINLEHVLFIERLRDESTVVRAITQDKEQRSQQGGETPLNNQGQPAANTDQTQPTDQNQQNSQPAEGQPSQ